MLAKAPAQARICPQGRCFADPASRERGLDRWLRFCL